MACYRATTQRSRLIYKSLEYISISILLLFSVTASATHTVSPGSIVFGDVTVGSTSSAFTVTFNNTNTGDFISFSSITTTGNFSITDHCSTLPLLDELTSCTIDVVFAPTIGGPQSGTLTISGSDPEIFSTPIPFTTTIQLSGNGLASEISIDTTDVDLGSVPLNSSSSTVPVTLTNPGNTAVDIDVITATSPFIQTNDCPAALNGGDSCVIQVSISPTSTGTVTGTLDINGSSTSGPFLETIQLNAIVTAPTLSTSPSSLSFPQSPVNTSSSPQQVTIQNTGNTALQINSISIDGDFSQTNDCGAEVAAGASCNAQVVFTPLSSGSKTGTLNIDTSSGIATIALSGTGEAATTDPVADLLRPYTGGNPNVISTSEVIAEACPSGRISARMQEDCDAVVGAAIGGDSGTGTALFQITPEPATKANRSTRQGGEAQSRNLGSRITALRAGARGLSFKGLDLQIDGQNLPIELIANSYKNSSQRGGGASADNQLLASRLGVFITGDIATGSKDETDLESGFDFDTYGITIGVDYRLTNQFILGGAVGYIDTNAEFESNGGDLDTQGVSLSLYGTYYSEQNYFVDFSATFGSNSFDQKRQIIYQLAGLADVNQTLKADYDGDMTNLFVGSGYDFNQGLWTFGPRADLEYIKSDVDGFTEEISDPTAAGGGWATRVGATDQSWLTLNVGGRASYTHSTDWGVVIPYARLDWLHEFKDDSQIITAHFVSDPAGNVIQIETDDPDRDYLRLRFGTSAQFQNGVVGFIDYGTILAHSDWSSHTISAGLRMEF